jgi:hypothetical protein
MWRKTAGPVGQDDDILASAIHVDPLLVYEANWRELRYKKLGRQAADPERAEKTEPLDHPPS